MKIVKKLIWFIIFVVVAIVAIVVVYKSVLKFEFKDDIKYKNINYSNIDNNICLSFNKNSYKLDDCNGGDSDLSFNSSKGCTVNYNKAYSSIIFDCGYKNINLVKIEDFNFNSIKFTSKSVDYVLINKSVFSTMEGLQKITFSFVDEDDIKFSKYINNNLVDEEVCHYKYGVDDSMGLECTRFYGYSAFKVEKYDGKSVVIINRGNRITFTLSS